jgi:hypothetical protein
LCSTLKTLIIQHDWTDVADPSFYSTALDADEDVASDYLIPVHELLFVLKRMPLLEHLDVRIDEMLPPDGISPTLTASLPNLKYFHIVGATAAYAQLVVNLRIPGCTKVHLDCWLPEEPDFGSAIVPFAPVLRGILAHTPSIPPLETAAF